jgi:glycolate dehydrogenase FAD-binding subunit
MNTVSTNAHAISDALAAISGREFLCVNEGVVTAAPANNEEVAAILSFANAHGCAVAPIGAGTKQGWGNPVRPGIVLETKRLNIVREHTWQDMTCSVEAGCTWSAMQDVLAQHGQFVALDPLWPERATVGGVIATNDSGTLRLKYGSLRDLVIGMTIVLADGTIAHSGGKVIKNVAGYDLHKLMIGAFGTLGVMTAVNFRLHAKPAHCRSFSISATAAGPLGELLLKLLDAQLSTQSMQLRSADDGYALDVRIASLPEVLETESRSLEALAQHAKLVISVSAADVWNARQECFGRNECIAIKATMLPSEIARFAEVVRRAGGASVTQATGIMTASLPSKASASVRQLREEVEAADGSLTVLEQAGPPENGLDTWGTLPDSLPLMRALKRRFDPNGILNPGCFLGGNLIWRL